MTTPEKITMILNKTGWTQAELGERLDVSQAHISHVLSENASLSRKTAKKLSRYADLICRQEFRLVFALNDSQESSCWIQPETMQHGAENLQNGQYVIFQKAVKAAKRGNIRKACTLLTDAGFALEFE